MVYRKWRRARSKTSYRVERHIAIASAAHINILQAFRTLPVLRSHFEHNIILVQLLVDDRNFGLTKGTIERRIQRRCGLAQPRGACAIKGYELRQSAILLV